MNILCLAIESAGSSWRSGRLRLALSSVESCSRFVLVRASGLCEGIIMTPIGLSNLCSERRIIVKHTAMADLCNILSFLLQVPTIESASAICTESMSHDFRAITSELGIDHDVSSIERGLDDVHNRLSGTDDALNLLRREYTRLFNHPKHPLIQLYEGVFIDSELVSQGKESTHACLFINPAAVDAERYYARVGFVCSSGMRVPPDCITTQLQFLGILHSLIAVRAQSGEEESCRQVCSLLCEFWDDHPSNWFDSFFNKCSLLSNEPLYRLVGNMGHELVSLEIRCVETLL